MKKIKWIIFDLGGIVVPEIEPIINRKIAEVLNISEKKLIEIHKKYKGQITSGALTLFDMYSAITNELGIQVSSKYLLQEHLNMYEINGIKHYNDVVLLIESLKKNYGVACLTNLEIEIADICRETRLYDYFDRAFLSTELKMQKPDLEIYHKVLESLKCKPEETVFIDDKIENVNSANKIGMHAIHYSNLDQLKIDLLEVCNAFPD